MIWLIAACALGLPLVFGFLTAPNLRDRRRRAGKLAGWHYAHRGLHGEGIPENSLSAFRRAADAGYGVELDVRLTRDGRLVILHDETLLRMAGIDRAVEDMTAGEIAACRLKGTEEGIPTLEDALRSIAGKAPLIVELKSHPRTWRALPEKALRALKDYGGVFAVESFDPRMLRYLRRNAPSVIRGQLACDVRKMPEKEKGGFLYWACARLLMNFLSRPDFIAYGYQSEGNLSFRMMRALFRPALAAWTVRSGEDSERLRDRYDLQIFESFRP